MDPGEEPGPTREVEFGTRSRHGRRRGGSIPLTAGIDSGTALILRSFSRAGSSVSSAPAAGRTALMGLSCSGGRLGAWRTARRGRAGVSQAGGRDRARARTRRLGAGGRPLKRPRRLPPPGFSAPGHPCPAPKPGSTPSCSAHLRAPAAACASPRRAANLHPQLRGGNAAIHSSKARAEGAGPRGGGGVRGR